MFRQFFTTDLKEGQSDYVLVPSIHNIVHLWVDGKDTEFEVILRLKEVPPKDPKKYSEIKVEAIKCLCEVQNEPKKEEIN